MVAATKVTAENTRRLMPVACGTEAKGSGVGVATVVRARASYVKLGSVSAAPNSAALVKRSAGSYSRAWASAAPTLGGTVLRSLVIDGASAVRILTSTAWAVDAEKGGCPASIS